MDLSDVTKDYGFYFPPSYAVTTKYSYYYIRAST